jgi:hypothetical protein
MGPRVPQRGRVGRRAAAERQALHCASVNASQAREFALRIARTAVWDWLCGLAGMTSMRLI